MNWLSQIFGFLQSFQCWITIAPWESAIRVRFGKNPKLLKHGINFRLPFFDRIFVQSTRLHTVYSTGQTITTRDNKILTLSMTILYTIDDIMKLYMSLSTPDVVLQSLVEGTISKIVSQTNSYELTSSLLENKVSEIVKDTKWGLGNIQVMITGYAYVRTYRLLQNEWRSATIGDLNSQTPK